MKTSCTRFDRIDVAVDAVIARIGPDIILATPLGIGKPNHFLNALYRRVKADPALSLKIFTALSLDRPRGSSELERRFLGPFVERVFADYPELDYVQDVHKSCLPANIEVSEFFLKTAAYLHNAEAQRHYISCNYTHAAREMLAHGVNLIAQEVAIDRAGSRLSLCSNTDVTLDLFALLAEQADNPAMAIAVVNSAMPFMDNAAAVPFEQFDMLLDDPAASHALFGVPNSSISAQDYAIGLHASSLVRDGGTLQIGIGSLGDAISQSLIIRDRHNERYRAMLGALSGSAPGLPRQLAPFVRGLYGCSEMFVNGFMHLIDAGIVRREVFDDLTVQQLLNQGKITVEVGIGTLHALREAGAIQSPLRAADVAYLQRLGIFRPTVRWEDGRLACDEATLIADLDHPDADTQLSAHALGTRLQGGIVLHGGFFLGPRSFYERLRELPSALRAKIGMVGVGYVNQLYGHEAIASAQRHEASFINTVMMATLMGAAASDGLENGQVISGVGGQYNFVAQAHALKGARSILLLRARHEHQGAVHSTILWNYGHTTIPRHLRDIVISEYGVADLRGQSDEEIIKRMLAITDSRFQNALLAQAKAAGKLDPHYVIPPAQRSNTPQQLEAQLEPFRAELVPYPFGGDFTPDELCLIAGLLKLKIASSNPLRLAGILLAGIARRHAVPAPLLQRMQLEAPASLKEKLYQWLLCGAV